MGFVVEAHGMNVGGKRANTIANTNADIMEQQADSIMRNAITNQFRGYENQSRATGEAAAQEAAGGFTSEGSGRASQLTAMERLQMEIDDIYTRAWNESDALRQKAVITRYEGKAQHAASKIGVLGTLLTGAAQTGQMALTMGAGGGSGTPKAR